MFAKLRSGLFLAFATAASPVFANPAQAPSAVDEPAAVVLLAIGVAGLVIGRRMAQRRD